MQATILGNEGDSEVSGGRVDEAIRRITREAVLVELAGPRGRLRGERGRRRTAILQDEVDPESKGTVERDATISDQEPDLPPRDGADQDPIRVLDGAGRRRRQARAVREPPDKAVGIKEDAQMTPRSASHASPVEK